MNVNKIEHEQFAPGAEFTCRADELEPWWQAASSLEQLPDATIEPPPQPVVINGVLVNPLAIAIWNGEPLQQALGVADAEKKLNAYFSAKPKDKERLYTETLGAYAQVFDLLDYFADEYNWLPGLAEQCQALKTAIKLSAREIGAEYGKAADPIIAAIEKLDVPELAAPVRPKERAEPALLLTREENDRNCDEPELKLKMEKEEPAAEQSETAPAYVPTESCTGAACAPAPAPAKGRDEELLLDGNGSTNENENSFIAKGEKILKELSAKFYELALHEIFFRLKIT